MTYNAHIVMRPWYKRKRYYVLAFVVLPVVVLVGVCSRPLMQPMGKAGRFDEEHDKAVAMVQPRSGNDAWPTMEGLVKSYIKVVDEEVARRKSEPDFSGPQNLYPWFDGLFVPEGTPPDSPDDPQHTLVARRVLDRFDAEGFWARFDALATCGYAAPPYARGTPLMRLEHPYGGQSRSICRALVARMRVVAREGDQREVVACLRRALDLARLTPPDYGIMSQLYQIAIEGHVLNALREECGAGHLNVQTLRACDELVRSIRQSTLQQYFAVERVHGLDFIELMHTDDGKGDGYLNPTAVPMGAFGGAPSPSPKRSGSLVGLFMDSKSTTRGKYTAAIDRISAAVEGSEPAPVILVREEAALANFQTRRTLLLGIALPALAKVVSIARQDEMGHDATCITIALALYHADHGCYPRTLAELSPTYVSTLPLDRFTMGPFGYLAEPSERPSHCTLYSWGYDLQDNGGVEHATNRNKAMSSEAVGIDYVLAQLGVQPAQPPKPHD